MRRRPTAAARDVAARPVHVAIMGSISVVLGGSRLARDAAAGVRRVARRARPRPALSRPRARHPRARPRPAAPRHSRARPRPGTRARHGRPSALPALPARGPPRPPSPPAARHSGPGTPARPRPALPRPREAQVDLGRAGVGPARRDHLGPRVELDALGAVHVEVAEERRLPAAEACSRRPGTGIGTLMPTMPDVDVELELARRAAVAGEDRRAVAVRVVVDRAGPPRRRCRPARPSSTGPKISSR